MFLGSWGSLRRKERESSGSLLLAIGQALETVREGSRDDEAQALIANKIVRRCLDKGAIAYKDYKTWRKLNPLVFTTILDESGELIGFFDVFPLKADAGEAIIAGELTERSLSIDHIVPFTDISLVTHLHIATILLNPRQRVFGPIIGKEILLLKLREFLETNYAPVQTRTYTAFAQSKAGKALLKRCGFSMVVLGDENEQHWPLYVLRPSETPAALFRFGRADNCLSRKAMLRRIDARIENIELQLRELIAVAVGGDKKRLPPSVQTKMEQRINAEVHRTAAFALARYIHLTERLEFCDLRELQDTIVSKSLWSAFEQRFTNKETLISKFDQLARLRNGIRHTRFIDDITEKEGEAAIIWFEIVLKPSGSERLSSVSIQ